MTDLEIGLDRMKYEARWAWCETQNDRSSTSMMRRDMRDLGNLGGGSDYQPTFHFTLNRRTLAIHVRQVGYRSE